ncbi:hypothetical protein ACSVDA_23320 [Cytobacillus sp. Hm23]
MENPKNEVQRNTHINNVQEEKNSKILCEIDEISKKVIEIMDKDIWKIHK